MGYEVTIVAGYTTFLFVVFAAWVGGYLDPLQHSLQDVLLGKMGDNRASYGVKSNLPPSIITTKLLTHRPSALMSNRVVEDENTNAIQDGVGKGLGGLVGKGGVGEDIGNTLSKGM